MRCLQEYHVVHRAPKAAELAVEDEYVTIGVCMLQTWVCALLMVLVRPVGGVKPTQATHVEHKEPCQSPCTHKQPMGCQ